MATSKERCVTCGNENAILKCEGCSESFCYNHVMDHRQELNKQLDEVEVIRDTIRQTLTQQTAEPKKHALIQQIDEWERESIKKIRQAAEETRQMLVQHTAKNSADMEIKLSKLTNQLRKGRQENDFFETDLRRWKQELVQLNEELTKPSNITIKHHPTPLVEKISVDILSIAHLQNININARWIQNGITVAGGNGSGNGLNQLYNPQGVYVDDDQTVYVADTRNHRIVEWKNGARTGQVVAGGNGQGNQTNQLNSPINVIVDKKNDFLIICDCNNQRVMRWPCRNGSNGETIISNISCYGIGMDNDGNLYVPDLQKHEVRRWRIGDADGIVVAGGNGAGNRLDQLQNPISVFVDQDHSLYVSDYSNHRVVKWMAGAKEGIVVAGGQGAGNGLTQLSSPFGIVLDRLGTVYVADHSNHRVMRWLKGATQGTVVAGGNGAGAQPNQLNGCVDLSFDRQGNLYVANHSYHRVQKFNIDPSSNT